MTHYLAVLLINPSRMNLFNLDLKSSMLPFREGRGVGFWERESSALMQRLICLPKPWKNLDERGTISISKSLL